MKAFIVNHRHEVVGIFRDIAKAADCAEKWSSGGSTDPDDLWSKLATITVKDVETDLL